MSGKMRRDEMLTDLRDHGMSEKCVALLARVIFTFGEPGQPMKIYSEIERETAEMDREQLWTLTNELLRVAALGVLASADDIPAPPST